jgi:DNA-binding PadR family transcriptional regulator
MGKNEIDLMILGLLMQGPAHGYELKKRIAISFGTQYPNLSDSAIYPRLAQFEKEGLVEGKVEQQQGVPNKKVYRLSEAGLKRMRELAATPVNASGVISDANADDLMVHIAFFSLITKEERRKVVEPFYNYALFRYEDATQKMEKYQYVFDKFSLTLLKHGIPMLKTTLEMYRDIMEID